MRSTLLALGTLGAIFLAPSSHAAECNAKTEIEAAFLAQQKHLPGWRVLGVSESNAGRQEQTIEYMHPDRIYRKVLVEGQEPAIETIGIAQWAWTDSGAGWGELQPPQAKMLAQFVQEALTKPPQAGTDFTCLGTVKYDGKDYKGYRSAADKAPDGSELVRTIYVDPATGLPAFNVIGPSQEGAEPLLKETYSYPADLSIEKP